MVPYRPLYRTECQTQPQGHTGLGLAGAASCRGRVEAEHGLKLTSLGLHPRPPFGLFPLTLGEATLEAMAHAMPRRISPI